MSDGAGGAGAGARRRVLLRGALGLALAAAVFVFVVPRIAGYGSVAHQLATVSAPWAAALAAAALLDILTSALPWKVVLPQLSWFGALAFPQASTALTSVLPGGAPLGMAISYGLLRRQRISSGEAGFAVALTGVWSQLAILVYPLVGAVLVFGSGRLSESTAIIAGVSGTVALVGAGGAFAALRSRRAALWLGRVIWRLTGAVNRLLRREPPAWDEEAIARFRDERVTLLRRRWPALTAATLANQLGAYLAFELSLRALGISFHQLPPTETFLAWGIGRLLSSLPLTPAGIGVVELGMIGTLVGFGAPHAHVVAAVLLYRGLIVVPTLVAGFLALLALRRGPATATS
jgi:uncharacterized membrane protein YbhN (UPF0104 family)